MALMEFCDPFMKLSFSLNALSSPQNVDDLYIFNTAGKTIREHVL